MIVAPGNRESHTAYANCVADDNKRRANKYSIVHLVNFELPAELRVMAARYRLQLYLVYRVWNHLAI